MLLDTTPAAITYFLEHIVEAGNTGSTDTTLRARVEALLQVVVNEYWTHPWNHKKTQATISFDSTGVATLPENFQSWIKDFGWVTWGEPYSTTVNGTHCNDKLVMSQRTIRPGDQGPPKQIAMRMSDQLADVGRFKLYRLPAAPPSPPESAVAFYYRKAPRIFDYTSPDPPPAPLTFDEILLIPEDHRLFALMDGVKPRYAQKQGDGREQDLKAAFLKACRDLFASENLDLQPARLGAPFDPLAGLASRPARRVWP